MLNTFFRSSIYVIIFIFYYMFYLGGVHAVHQTLVRYPRHVKMVWLMHQSQHAAVFEASCREHGVKLAYCDKRQLDLWMPDVQHQGVAAAYEQLPSLGLEDLCTQAFQRTNQPLFLMLDHIQDPQNLGACLRSAAAFGVDGVIVPKDRAVGITPTVLKVAVGAAAIVPVVRVNNLARAMRQLKDLGCWFYGTAESASECLSSADVSVPLVWVMGNESKGLSKNVMDTCDALYAIETGAFSTLNISVSTGIVLHATATKRQSLSK